MKRNWQPEELIEHWTLIPPELDLLTKKTAINRLGIALLLKYFQYEGRFPTSKAEIPNEVVCYVAQLLKVSPDRFDNYDWQGRTIKAHRAIVREFLGITEATVKDAENLTAWLETQVLAYDLKPESLEIVAKERLRYLKIEPPTSERIERTVRSAIRSFEDSFCDKTAQQLQLSVRTKLDELLKTTSETDNLEEQAETEAILKRFTRSNLSHPTYRALAELGKVIKTIFLCKYLHSESLRREVNESLNVVESWNNANGFIFFGKGKEIATNRLEDQEVAVLSLHLLQSCLVYVNTLMIQDVLSEPGWMNMMNRDDLSALTPLIWSHVNPYGTFRLNLDERLPIQIAA